jgi:hypothetical protein
LRCERLHAAKLELVKDNPKNTGVFSANDLTDSNKVKVIKFELKN